MPTDVVMPQMGESIFEGTITKWLKQPGEKVQRDEPLFEISTDKVDAEIPAPASGTLQDIKVQAGATVQVNTVVGTIAAEGEAGTATAPTPAATSAKPVAGGDGSGTAQTEAPRMEKDIPADLSVDEKMAWNASNRALYSNILKLASGSVCAPARWCARSPRRTMSI